MFLAGICPAVTSSIQGDDAVLDGTATGSGGGPHSDSSSHGVPNSAGSGRGASGSDGNYNTNGSGSSTNGSGSTNGGSGPTTGGGSNNNGNTTGGSDSSSHDTGSGGSASGDSTGVDPCPVGTWGCAPRDDYDIVVITISDVARYHPSPGIQRMEPDGWVIVGLPANIYSVVGTRIVAGELLDQPADVRFTPIAWHWDYGDGSTATLATKGASWAAQGLDEFDTTPTSHIYREAGEYTIRLSITFRAEYRFAGSTFVPISGTITLPANELHITAGGAKTVLVDRDCSVAPRGPGC